MSRSRPTAKELAVIRSALHNAYDERNSYADALRGSPQDREHFDRTVASCKAYEDILERWFKEKPHSVRLRESAGKPIDIFTLVNLK